MALVQRAGILNLITEGLSFTLQENRAELNQPLLNKEQEQEYYSVWAQDVT